MYVSAELKLWRIRNSWLYKVLLSTVRVSGASPVLLHSQRTPKG